jgi:hypothetical protein
MANITSISNNDFHKPKRQCGSCTKCCDGWLTTEIEGQAVCKGSPCKYRTDAGCSNYQNRPVDPCRTYECAWLTDSALVPESFKPVNSGVIMTRRWTPKNSIPYLEIKEAGNRLPVEVLDWAIQQVQHGLVKNIHYEIAGVWRHITSQQGYAEEMIEPEL